jgi:PIN domain
MRNLQANRPDLGAKLERRRSAMRRNVPDWQIPEAAWSPLEAALVLPDPGDAHVLAAAIAGHADCIVTTNLKDFPKEMLAPWSIEAIHPDEFIVAQMDLRPITALAAFKAMRSRRQRPQESAEQFAAALERNGLVLTASKLKEAAALI